VLLPSAEHHLLEGQGNKPTIHSSDSFGGKKTIYESGAGNI
jgi:hypothetical protein